MEEQLRASWLAALEGDASRGALDALDDLVGRYREPHRRYHTVKHLAYALAAADELMGSVVVGDRSAVRLALFFHDAVYDPRASTNEADSAALARRVLAPLGVTAARLDAVASHVELTAGHVAPAGDLDAAVVLDADLSVLADRPAVYDAYVNGVRSEFAHVDEAGWRAGRADFLRGLLARPAIFSTEPMRAREARARANLAAELATLTT